MNMYCKRWAQCRKPNCRYLHPWNLPVYQGIQWPQQPCPQYNPMTGDWQHAYQWDPKCPYLPNFCPASHYHGPIVQQNFKQPTSFNNFQGGYQPQQAESIIYASEVVSSPPSQGEDLTNSSKNPNPTNQSSPSNSFAEELQIQNDPLYKSLLKFYQGDINKTLEAYYNLQQKFEQEKMPEDPNEAAFTRTIIIINFLGLNFFKPERIEKIIHKFNNILDKIIERLMKLIERKAKANEFQIKLARLPSILPYKYEGQLPQKCQFLVDGFNVIHKNKHLRNIFYSQDLRDKAEAMIRLRILLETLANGNLVFDKKFLTDNQQQQIFDKIGVKIEQPKLLKTIYADDESTADEKILQILRNMPKDQHKFILLVTSDRQLIQLSLDATDCNIKLMEGSSFIKACKKRHEVGSRKRILIRKSS